jgi:hypothetical protein
MSSRLLVTGLLAGAAVRRKRKSDGAIFAIVRIMDSDRFERREWTCFVNDPAIIEQLEEMRVGEPIAATGPFSVLIADGGRIEHRITIETLVDVKRRKKPKGMIRKEQRVESDELDRAPQYEFDDPVPFGEQTVGSDLNDALKERRHG